MTCPTTIYRMLKFHRTRKNGNPIWIFVMKPLCRHKLVILKTRMHVPVSTTLAWQCFLERIIALPLKSWQSNWSIRQDGQTDSQISIILADGPIQVTIAYESLSIPFRNTYAVSTQSYPSDVTHNYIWPAREPSGFQEDHYPQNHPSSYFQSTHPVKTQKS